MGENKQKFDWKTMTREATMKYLETAVHDCSFAVGKTPEETKIIKSYKAILASVSTVFDRMFNGDFLESHASEGIPITDTDANDWQMFLQYITHGAGSFVVFSEIAQMNIYWLAKKYEIKDIMDVIICGDLYSIGHGYVLIKALAIAVDCKDERWIQQLKTAINHKITTKPIWGSCIYDVDEDTFCQWLQCAHSALEKFNYIDTYAKVHGLKRSAGGLEKMLKLVNLSCMSAAEFHQGPQASDILTTTEKLDFWATRHL